MRNSIASKIPLRAIYDEMKSSGLHVAKSKTGHNALYMLVTQLIVAGIGFVLNILIIRRLSLEQYGLFSLFLSSFVLVNYFLSFGWPETYIRFGAKISTDRELSVIRKYFLNKTYIFSTTTVVIGLFLSPWIVRYIYHRSDFLFLFQGALALAFLSVLVNFLTSDLILAGRFKKVLWLHSGLTVARLICVLALPLLNLWTPLGCMIAYVVPWLVCAMAALLKKKNSVLPAFRRVPYPLQLNVWIPEFDSYQKWLAGSLVLFAFSNNLDIPSLAFFCDNETIARYGVTLRLTQPFQLIINALGSTLLARYSQSHDSFDISRFLSKTRLFWIPLCLVAIVYYWGSRQLLVRWVGVKYANVNLLLLLQIGAISLSVLWRPFSFVIQAAGRMRSLVTLYLVQIFSTIGLNFFLIPRFGAYGAAISSLLCNGLGVIWTRGQLHYMAQSKQ